MSGEPDTMVEKAVSTLKVRDLLIVPLTRWTSLISLTKPPLDDPRRSAAPAPSAEPNKASAEPRNTMLKARSVPPPLLATRPPLIRFPFAEISGLPRNVRFGRPNNPLLAPGQNHQRTDRGLPPAEMRQTKIIIGIRLLCKKRSSPGRRNNRDYCPMWPASTTFPLLGAELRERLCHDCNR